MNGATGTQNAIHAGYDNLLFSERDILALNEMMTIADMSLPDNIKPLFSAFDFYIQSTFPLPTSTPQRVLRLSS